MGREIKRVALGFDWPLDKVWEGFLMPDKFDGETCTDCQGGQTHAGWWIQTFSQRLGMLATDVVNQKRGEPMHPWLLEDPYPHGHWEGKPFVDSKYVVDRPSEDILDLYVGLSKFVGKEVTRDSFEGFLGGDSYLIYRVLVKAAGLGEELADTGAWGSCKTCNGVGETEKYEGQFAERDAWEQIEPPAGEGWQVWETVSEGSPISPVFADREGLIQWLMSPAYTWGVSKPLSREQAESFTGSGWAPTMVFSTKTGVVSGDQFTPTQEEK